MQQKLNRARIVTTTQVCFFQTTQNFDGKCEQLPVYKMVTGLSEFYMRHGSRSGLNKKPGSGIRIRQRVPVPGNLGGGENPVVEEEGAEPLIVDHAHQSPQLAHDSLLVPRVHPQVLRTLIRGQQGQGKAETSNVKTTRTVFI
jgi:hypothetical protein